MKFGSGVMILRSGGRVVKFILSCDGSTEFDVVDMSCDGNTEFDVVNIRGRRTDRDLVAFVERGGVCWV